jgi:hypothetical protein
MPGPSIKVNGAAVTAIGADTEHLGLVHRLLRLRDSALLNQLGVSRLSIQRDGGRLAILTIADLNGLFARYPDDKIGNTALALSVHLTSGGLVAKAMADSSLKPWSRCVATRSTHRSTGAAR